MTMQNSPDRSGTEHFAGEIRKMQNALRLDTLDMPVIALVDGMCLGAGLDLVSFADICYCTKDALFSIREARLGLLADIGGLHNWPIKCGKCRGHRFGRRSTEKTHLTASLFTCIRKPCRTAGAVLHRGGLWQRGCSASRDRGARL